MPTQAESTSAAESSDDNVRPDELLMRRLLLRKTIFRAASSPPIQEGAFQPGKNDRHGLSLSRRRTSLNAHFLDEWQFKKSCTHPDTKLRDSCGVCAFLTEAAREIGLRVQPDPTTDDPGHVILPQINYLSFENSDSDRAQIRIWINQLIEHASKLLLIPPGTANP